MINRSNGGLNTHVISTENIFIFEQNIFGKTWKLYVNMQISYLVFFVSCTLALGLNCPVYANLTQTKTNKDSKGLRESRFRKFVNNLNQVELKIPRISRKKVDCEDCSIENLTLKLREIEKIRSNSRNPFKKLRCYIQESNIKRKLRSLLKEKEEEEKLEKLEEEFSMDYSPQVLSEEGSVPPYIPVVVGNFKEDTNTPEIFVGDDDTVQTKDKSLVSEEMSELNKVELEESTHPVTSEVGIDVESDEDIENQETASENMKDNLEDDLSKNPEQAQASESTDLNLEENTAEQEKEDKKKTKSRPKSLFSLFKKKKPTASEELEKLLTLKANLESKISNCNPLLKPYFKSKLKNVNKKISKITEEAVDAVTGLGEIDLQ